MKHTRLPILEEFVNEKVDDKVISSKLKDKFPNLSDRIHNKIVRIFINGLKSKTGVIGLVRRVSAEIDVDLDINVKDFDKTLAETEELWQDIKSPYKPGW